MSNYDPAVRPSLSAAQPVAVAFRLSLLALLALDERRGVLSSSCRITQKWNDVHLRWNASDFGGVATVRIPAGQIWRPDILLRNNADPSSPVTATDSHAVLHSSGDISWTSQSLLKSACTVDLRFFPFDVHICYLNFTSWSYDSKQTRANKRDSRGTPPILITWQIDNWKPASLDHVRTTKSESTAVCLFRWLCNVHGLCVWR